MTSPPKTRGECAHGPRPCPWESCRYHLSLRDYGGRRNALVPRCKRESCALDVADQGPHFLDEIAKLFGVTRERVRQIEEASLHKLARSAGRELREELRDLDANRPDADYQHAIPRGGR